MERFHQTLRRELLDDVPVWPDLEAVRGAVGAVAAIPYAAAGVGDSASLSIHRRLSGMKRRLLRATQFVGFLFWLGWGVGLWLGWPDEATWLLLLAGLLLFQGPTVIADWRERESRSPKSAEEVLRWYPKWWA